MSAGELPAEKPSRIWIEVLAMWVASAVAIRLAVSLGDFWLGVVKSLALMYLPIGYLLWKRRDLTRYGLHLDRIRKSLTLFAIVSVVTLIPFWTANHLWETFFLHHRMHFHFPPDTLSRAAGELIAVALPEELFYRGYLQTRLTDVLPPRRAFIGARVGWALPVASIIFVAGHLAVHPALWQLSIFFPGLVFGWMRIRTDSLVSPILYHALCNLGMYVLQHSYY